VGNLPIPGRYGDCKKYKVKVVSLELDKGIDNFHLFIILLLGSRVKNCCGWTGYESSTGRRHSPGQPAIPFQYGKRNESPFPPVPEGTPPIEIQIGGEGRYSLSFPLPLPFWESPGGDCLTDPKRD
jgi:hypothetical protein